MAAVEAVRPVTTPLQQLAAIVRRLDEMIVEMRGWQAMIGDPALSIAIAFHLDALETEQRDLVRFIARTGDE